VGHSLSVVRQNRQSEDGVGHVLRSSGLLRDRVFQFGLKTGGGVTAGGARGTIMNVVLGSSETRTGRCDGLRRTLLPLLCHFLCIRPYGHSSLLIFYLVI
jgi:hypothetical protein